MICKALRFPLIVNPSGRCLDIRWCGGSAGGGTVECRRERTLQLSFPVSLPERAPSHPNLKFVSLFRLLWTNVRFNEG